MDTGLTPSAETPELHKAIEGHYDGLIQLYEDLWGEHIHHGYWEPGQAGTDRHLAQVRTVDRLVEFAGVPAGSRVLDAGCGVGASAVYLAQQLGCEVEGITLSREQVLRAEQKAAEAGVTGQTRFRQLDAMATGYPDGSFDAVWALESCELMPDKRAFLSECHRVLRPGGVLAVATWCARDDQLTESEVRLLRRIYRDFVVSHVLPLDDYEKMCWQLGYGEVRAEEWTDRVRDTWKLSTDIVRPFVRDPSYVWKLIRAKGVDIFRFLNSVPLMKQAYDRGVMRYGVFRATKPAKEALS
ncbi:MAG TPA: methyltransferase domain-containing protein [Micromonosporaceae bacterium]|nr:methyltransferase domain-containing protein [Micromonosporaceae bacterium]